MANDRLIIDYRELGSSGLRRYSGFVLEDFLPELQGWRGIARYKEMAWNDPVIGASLFAIRMLCRRVPWRTTPATSQPYDKAAGEFLWTCMNDMNRSWLDMVDEILRNMLPFGHAPEEIVYKRRCGRDKNPYMNSKYADGRIGWRKLEIRHPDTIWRWQFDDHGGIQGAYQLAPPHFKHTFIPITKMALFRTTTDMNNPEGLSILRNAFRPWYMCKNLENIEAIGMERDLAGLPVATVPSELLSQNASPEQKALLSTIREIATNIRRDEQEGVVFPSDTDDKGNKLYDLKLLSTGGSRQFDTDKVIQRYNTLKAMTVLADFIFMGHNAGGNRSIVDKRTDLFSSAIGAYLDIIADVMNNYAIPRLFDLNPDIEYSDYPKIEHGDLESVDLQQLGDYISKLAGAGYPLFPNDDLQKYLMKVGHMPEPLDPMKLTQELETQPKKQPKPGEQVVIPPDPFQAPTTEEMPLILGQPGVPPLGGEVGTQVNVNSAGDPVVTPTGSMFDRPQGGLG